MGEKSLKPWLGKRRQHGIAKRACGYKDAFYVCILGIFFIFIYMDPVPLQLVFPFNKNQIKLNKARIRSF